RQEVGRLQGFVKLRLDYVEAYAVVECQPRRHLPVILNEPLNIVVAVLADEITGRLVVRVVDANRGIGEPKAGIERIVGIIRETDISVVIGKTALRLEAVFPEDTDLEAVLTPNFGEAAAEVDHGIEIGKRRVVRAHVGSVCDAPAKGKLRWHVELNRTGKDRRESVQAQRRAVEIGIAGENINRVMADTERGLQNGSRVEGACSGHRPAVAGEEKLCRIV